MRFGSETRIFDREKHELTPARQNIVPGAQLRLLVDRDMHGEAAAYRASYIWIGD